MVKALETRTDFFIYKQIIKMYKVQTNFFGGDATFIEDFIEFNTFDEAVDYVMNNKPPSEFEWDVRENGKGGALAWTQFSGEKVSAWINGKIVVLRGKT